MHQPGDTGHHKLCNIKEILFTNKEKLCTTTLQQLSLWVPWAAPQRLRFFISTKMREAPTHNPFVGALGRLCATSLHGLARSRWRVWSMALLDAMERLPCNVIAGGKDWEITCMSRSRGRLYTIQVALC